MLNICFEEVTVMLNLSCCQQFQNLLVNAILDEKENLPEFLSAISK